MTRADYQRGRDAALLVNWITTTAGGTPTLHDGVIGDGIPITPETVAAIGLEQAVFGRGVAVPLRVAQEAAAALRGQAALNAATGGVR